MSRAQEIEKAIEKKADTSFILEMIMDEYGTSLKRLIFTYVKDWGIASDLTQEVFITVYEKLASFEQRSSLKTWLFSIAINKSKDYLKSWHFRNLFLNDKVFLLKKETEKSPEAKYLIRAEQNYLVKQILSLPLKYREILQLHYYQDLSIQEISSTLKIPIGTVKTRLYRGQEKLKNIISNDRGDRNGQSKERL